MVPNNANVKIYMWWLSIGFCAFWIILSVLHVKYILKWLFYISNSKLLGRKNIWTVFIFPSFFPAFFIQTIGQCNSTTLLPICFTKYWNNANVIFFIVITFQATPNNINLKSPSCLLSKHFLSQCHQCISWSSPKSFRPYHT